MNITAVIIAAALIAIVGIIVGIGLGVFSEKFAVEVDPREAEIREALPGNNCGGCGYPGCDGCAKAINEGAAPVSACPVGQKPVWDKIASIMGVEAGDQEKMVAFVKCAGTCEKAPKRYIYTGPDDCNALAYSVNYLISRICNLLSIFRNLDFRNHFSRISILYGSKLVNTSKRRCIL